MYKVLGIASANAHRKKRAINFDILKPVTYGIIFGAFLGAVFALQLEGYVLKLIIAFFALAAALRIGFSIEFQSPNKRPGDLISYSAGSGIGLLLQMYQ